MRFAIGRVGSIIKRYRYWPHGSSCGKPIGGKKWTPAITFPQIRQGIAMILREAFQCNMTAHMLKECQQRLQRNELARFYHWNQRNRLAPLHIAPYGRTFQRQPLNQGPARGALEAYVPRLITSPSS